jgi:predicted dehydrogenase
MASRLNVGAIGLGGLGRVYAQYLAQRVSNARLVAVADQKAELEEQFARDFGVSKWYRSHQDLVHSWRT